MKSQKNSNLIYNHYSSINLNNYFPSNQRSNFLNGSSNNCNFNKINPINNGKTQQMQNNRNFSTPNYINSKKSNSSINLNNLNIAGNTQSKNAISSKYASSSSIKSNYNYFSPLPKEINKIPNYTNLNNIKIQNNNKITKHISSPLLNCDKPNVKGKIKNKNKARKKALILDLDETLVHSGFNKFNRKSDIVLNINIDGKNHIIYVLKRPYIDEFLREISKYFEIFIFTASIHQYASPLLDVLDKEKICDGRLYRENCIYNGGLYLKDLKQIERDLKDVIIIDNNPASYALNQENGIPILTWYDNINDNELNKLVPLLKYLSKVDDVRPVINQIVDREKNEVNFDLVDVLIKNGKINGINDDINYKKRHMDENLNINKNTIDNNQKNKFRKYIENGNNNLYEYNKYKDSIDSLSNMTYDEIQNEGHLDNNNKNNNNNNVDYNLDKFNDYKKRNNSILNRTKELFNGITNNNNVDYFCVNDNYKNDRRSYTPNLNMQRKNNYYNKEKINDKDNLNFKSQKNINNIIDIIQENIQKESQIYDNMNDNFDFRKSKDILFNGINDLKKENNYLLKSDKCINNFYLNSSKKTAIKTNEKINRNQKLFNINNNKKNNVKNKEENKNINCFFKSNANYLSNNNNINKKNIDDNNLRIGFNYNTLNNKKVIENKIEKNNNNINLNYMINSKNNYNETTKNNTNEIINNNSNNSIKSNNNKSIIELRREKLNEIKRKMEEINNDIKQSEEKLYHTQNIFMPKNEMNKKNHLFSPNYNNLNQEEKGKGKNNRKAKDKISNLNDANNFNRSFSENKSFLNNDLNSISSYYYINKNGINQNNIRTITNTDDIDYIKKSSNNYRADTEISANSNNYNIDTIMDNVEKNNFTRSLVVNKRGENYNDINILDNDNAFNHTYNTGFLNPQKKMNINDINGNTYLNNKEIGSYGNAFNKNYNNININNFNIRNRLIGENKAKINNENKLEKISNNEYNGKLLMNKSSSNFYPRISIDLNEEEKNININDRNVKDIIFENNYKYEYNKYNFNSNERIINEKNSFNQFKMDNTLFRTKSFNNCYNYDFN